MNYSWEEEKKRIAESDERYRKKMLGLIEESKMIRKKQMICVTIQIICLIGSVICTIFSFLNLGF